MTTPHSRMTLGASERLKSRKQIGLLFAKGKSISRFPVKVIYRLAPLEEGQDDSLKFMVTVPKRKFKRAVDRNLLKRRVREAYRQENQGLKNKIPAGYGMDLVVLYLAPEIREFNEIREKLVLSLQKLERALDSENK
ncbi:ribonuclease P protein component [bacterium SCSIO 12741]|nr:ribonuclease P protein component [bacterium SCSIO 12741]